MNYLKIILPFSLLLTFLILSLVIVSSFNLSLLTNSFIVFISSAIGFGIGFVLSLILTAAVRSISSSVFFDFEFKKIVTPVLFEIAMLDICNQEQCEFVRKKLIIQYDNVKAESIIDYILNFEGDISTVEKLNNTLSKNQKLFLLNLIFDVGSYSRDFDQNKFNNFKIELL